MARNTLLPGYTRAPSGPQSYIGPNGEKVSKRQYAALARQIKYGEALSNEKLAARNKAADPLKAILRPAPGRKGASRLSPAEREVRAQALRDAAEVKAANEKARRAEEKILSSIQRKLKSDEKKTAVFSLQKLVSGRAAYKTFSRDPAELEQARQKAKASGKVYSYAVGLVGYSAQDGRELTPTLIRLQSISIPLNPRELEAMGEEYEEEHAYFILSGYWIHFHFKAEYIQYRANKAGVQVGQTKKRKRK